jgi:c(7)-type cytochrome triheme protein
MTTRKTEFRRQKSDVGCQTEVTDDRSQKSDLRPLTSGFRSLLLALLFLVGLLFGVAFAVDGDIVFKREGGEGGIPAAIFPHWFHRIRYKCYACHPTPFEMKAGANKITMDALQEGKFCGVCHNGKVAWAASFETCNRCHVEK